MIPTKKQSRSRLLTSILATVILLSAFTVQTVPQTARATDNCQTFSETGFSVCGKFLQYWQNHGGLLRQGFPISAEFDEQNAQPPAGDGQTHRVQYFQRARFEYHPENAAPNDILLGLLGTEQYSAKYGQPVQGTDPSKFLCKHFDETGYTVCGLFLVYWELNGGLAQEGFPISGVIEEANQPPPAGDGKVHKVQYFQRARFEEHLDLAEAYKTLLGLLGAEQFKTKYGSNPPTNTQPPPANPTPTPTPTPTPKPTPMPTQPPVQAPGYAGVKFLQVNGTSPGSTASVLIETMPNLTCSITYIVPSGRVSTAQGLDPKVADGNGQVYWSWLISGNTGRGTGSVNVSCGPYSNSAAIIIG